MKKYLIFALLGISVLTSCKSTQSCGGCPYRTDMEYKISVSDIRQPVFLTANNDANKNFSDILSQRVSGYPQLPDYSNAILEKAFEYEGVRYRRGGLSEKGIDCSGLVYQCYSFLGIALPRKSIDMAKAVNDIPREEAKKGDLIFFKTNTKSNRINHVGIVIDSDGDDIKFIHASINKGVTVSSTQESYYSRRYAKIGRVLEI